MICRHFVCLLALGTIFKRPQSSYESEMRVPQRRCWKTLRERDVIVITLTYREICIVNAITARRVLYKSRDKFASLVTHAHAH